MTLRQLGRIRLRQQARRARAPIEYHTWDAVLTLWLMGWMGLPSALLLAGSDAVIACAVACTLPALYTRLRAVLHRRGALRCDWIDAAPARRVAPRET